MNEWSHASEAHNGQLRDVSDMEQAESLVAKRGKDRVYHFRLMC